MSKRHELLVLLNSRRHWWQIAWVVCAADIKSLFALSCTTNMLLFMFTSRSAASLPINLHSPISIRCSISNGFYGDNSSSFVVHSRTFEFRPTHQFRAQFSNVFNSIKANLFHRWYIYSRDTIKSKVETNKRSLGARRDRKKRFAIASSTSIFFSFRHTKNNQRDWRLSGCFMNSRAQASSALRNPSKHQLIDSSKNSHTESSRGSRDERRETLETEGFSEWFTKLR